jgi:hypothetical protein
MVVFQSGGEKTAGYRRTSQIYILAFQLYEREQLGQGREETKRFFMRKFALRARVAYFKPESCVKMLDRIRAISSA